MGNFVDLHKFKGRKLHSHYFRKAEEYKGLITNSFIKLEKNLIKIIISDCIVLIIGAGPSGMDMTNLIDKHAARIYLSNHSDPPANTKFMKNVIQKPDVERFTENGAIFKDGSEENFTDVLLCTGYNYSFPFLSMDCGITIEENYIAPLYKHIININIPNMAFIGMVYQVLPNQVFDLQIQFALKYFMGLLQMPSKEEMLNELNREIKQKQEKGVVKSKYHQLGSQQVC